VNASVAIATVSMSTRATPPGIRVIASIPAPTSAAQGIVSTHARMMFPATPHRTAESLVLAPAPSTEPLTVCVVETGYPYRAVSQRIAAVEVWAANP